MVESDSSARVIQNLVGYPAAVEQYKAVPTESFIKEDPSLLDPRALEPLSGRKQWKLRHNKRIHKPLKADKKGYIGGSWSSPENLINFAFC